MADEAAFAEFYRVMYPGLVAEMYAYTGSMAEAQEIVQEAFTRAWPRWRRVGGYDHPRAWVARVAYRLAVSRWRRARSLVASLSRHGPPPTAAPAAPPGEASVALVAGLSRLPEAQRRALVMHHMGGWPIAEIADVEGVAEGTIKARLSRGRQRLAALLDAAADDKEETWHA
ncbi:SigE family RNA polymerase sigma factor [Actinomadura kijaniata]|uniref:RNA polymerase sigma-70 factor (ECF subfamily) n=1 Tax=Actinomadura namibiensis TaxID=182080 RepID=A0A7W3LJ31_ACTNM|nr:sigma-70 family RNA polymerase sigma factor [Actinomadura namibiensis]MBA8949056.1 RNA polymerase sigma-70 factor (ECF subfamily) [Actinomadura namibiensis]